MLSASPAPYSQHATAPLDWVDALKGFGILLVVFGHALRGTKAAGLWPDEAAPLFAALDTRIYAFHMPLFFMISGFFLVQSLKRSVPSGFVRTRLTRLIWPLVLWTYIFLAAKLAAGSLANDPVVLDWRLLIPIPGQEQFWFLWALFLLHMLVLALRPALLSERVGGAALGALLAGSLGLLLLELPTALHHWTSRALLFLPFVAAGMALAQIGALRDHGRGVGVSGGLLACALIALVPVFPTTPPARGLLGLAICLSLVAFASWAVPRMIAHLRWLIVLGQASMIIYLSHTLFSAPLRIVLMKLGSTDLAAHVILGTLVGLTAPLVLNTLRQPTGRPALFRI